MKISKSACLSVAILVAAIGGNAKAAEVCKLVRVASLDMTPTDDGRIFVPVKIEGQSKLFLLDTGAPVSTVEADTVEQLGLKTQRLMQGQLYNSLGQEFMAEAHIHSFQLDQSTASTIKMAVDPTRISSDARLAGLLGADILQNYDVELDFANQKVNLFSQDHCEGKVIYWPADVIAVVPVHIVRSGHIIMSVVLDDQNINALFDTGADFSYLDNVSAENLFHLGPDKLQKEDGGAKSLYSHTFKTLALEGIAIGHPRLFIERDMATAAITSAPDIGTRLGNATESGGDVPMIFGVQQMKHLHIFIAYKERKLYVTPAGKPASAAAPASPAAPAPATPAAASPAPPQAPQSAPSAQTPPH